jgi:SAM-dependent methyltransferase
MSVLPALLRLPHEDGRDLDDPGTTARRRQIVRDKRFLNAVYREWYGAIAAAVPDGREPALELGSGAGFLGECVPHVVTSDVLPIPGIDVVLDAGRLPFGAGRLRAVVMTNVLHHLPDVGAFFREAARVVRVGGVIVMLEPWNTPWSRFVYRRLHHEPFEPDAAEWRVASGGPLSGANGALPWIVFERDRARFEREFPMWRVQSIRCTMPLRYLLSGGVSMRSLMPGWSFGFWSGVEQALTPWMARLALFATIVLVRLDTGEAVRG